MLFFNRLLQRFIKYVGGLRNALGLTLFVGLMIALCALFFFGWLADEMAEGDTARFDESIRAFVHSYASPFLTGAMHVFSFLGSTIFFVLLGIVIVGVFYYLRHRRAALIFTITTLGASILITSLKFAFHRARPEPFFNTILPSSDSFPSGHSLGSFCFYLAFAAILNNRIEKLWLKILIWTVSAALVLLIGISRIYLGVHYPSDVLAGFVVGFIWVITIAVGDKLLKVTGKKLES